MSQKNTRYLEKKILENTDRLIECAIAASLLGSDAKEKELRRGVRLISDIALDLKELIEVKDEYLPEILSQIISQKLPDVKIQQSLGTFTEELERMLRLGTMALTREPFEFQTVEQQLDQDLPAQTGTEVEDLITPPVLTETGAEPEALTQTGDEPDALAQTGEEPAEEPPASRPETAAEQLDVLSEIPLKDPSGQFFDESVSPEAGILLSDLLGTHQEPEQVTSPASGTETVTSPCYELPLNDDIILDPFAQAEQVNTGPVAEIRADQPPVVELEEKVQTSTGDGQVQEDLVQVEAVEQDFVQASQSQICEETSHEEPKERAETGESASTPGENIYHREEPQTGLTLDDFQTVDSQDSGESEAAAAMAPLQTLAPARPVRGLELSLKQIYPDQEILKDVTLNGMRLAFYLPARNLVIDAAVPDDDYQLKQKLCRQEGWEYFSIEEEDSKNPRRVERILRRTRTAARV